MFPITDHVLIFTLIISVILFAKVLRARLRIPDLVLLLVAGAALGEHGFGILERNDAITLFGEVGLLYIMFLAGLEIDLYQFSRTRGRSVGFGLATFVLPQVLGAWVAYEVLGDLSWASAILIASMFASHTLLAYPVASRLGIHRTEPVTISVGATIITDTLALVVLAVVLDVNRGVPLDGMFWGGLLVSIAVLVLCIALVVPRLARWFFQHAGESGGSQFLFVLAVVCACAYLSEFARMKPLIGAFLAGVALNRQIPEHSTLMNRLEFIGNVLFIPFFLISVGMLVNPEVVFGDTRTWKVIGVMVGLVVGTKWIAAMLAGAWFGYSFAERQLMFGLTVVQAAATLAAALVGFEAGLVSESALNGAIAMIMVTVPLGSCMVQVFGRKVALAAEDAPAPRRSEQRLMLAVKDTDTADNLVDLAMWLRDTSLPGGLFPVTIVGEGEDPERAVANGEKLLARCVARASSAEVVVEPHVRMDINPVDGLIRAVREVRAGVVLTGWGEEATRGSRLFGGVRRNLAEGCACRLIRTRFARPMNTCRHLRIPFPPLAEHRSDLGVLVRETKLLAKQAGLDLVVYLAGPASGDIQKRFEDASPGVETRFEVAGTWKEARQKLFAETRESDVLVLPQIRRDTALWTPTLDKLPELVAKTFPRTNLLVVYPAVRDLSEEVSGPVALPASQGFPALRGVDLDPDLSDEARVSALVREGLPDDPPMAEEAIPLLVDSANLTPVELRDDTLLLHAHCGERKEPLLLVGHGGGEGGFFEQENTPRVLVALLSPRGDAPELHLRSLAQVAKRFRAPGVERAMEEARSASQVCNALSDN